MEWLDLDLRDFMLILVVAASVYLFVILFKLIQVGRRPLPPVQPVEPSPVIPPGEPETLAELLQEIHTREAAEVTPSASRAAKYYEEMAASEPQAALRPAVPPPSAWDEVQELFGEHPSRQKPAGTPAGMPAPDLASSGVPPRAGFGEHLADHLARSEVEMEMQRMRDEMQRMRDELDALRAARNVSPHYGEALELMQRGKTAQEVADHLGISLAEAELVQALSRGRQNFD